MGRKPFFCFALCRGHGVPLRERGPLRKPEHCAATSVLFCSRFAITSALQVVLAALSTGRALPARLGTRS